MRSSAHRSPESLPKRQRIIFSTAIYTGLRSGELWGLRWEDVRLDGADPHLVVRYGASGRATKGGRPRTVPLLPPAISALREWRTRGGADHRFGHVFLGRHGPHKRGYDAGWAVTWRAKTKTREGVVFHTFRHTCASHLIMGSWGRPWRLEEVQVMLGHRSRTTTERYAHLAPGTLLTVAAETRDRWTAFGHDSGTGESDPTRNSPES